MFRAGQVVFRSSQDSSLPLPAAGRLGMTERTVMRSKWHALPVRTPRRGLSADQKNSGEDSGDPRPLPAGDVFAQENRCEANRNRAVQRAKYADDCYLFQLHAAIAQNECESIERSHAQGHPTHAAARKAHGLCCRENYRRRQEITGQANHPHGLDRADARHNADPEQPEQSTECYSGGNGHANATSVCFYRLRGIYGGHVLSASDHSHAKQNENDSANSRTREMITAEPGKNQC